VDSGANTAQVVGSKSGEAAFRLTAFHSGPVACALFAGHRDGARLRLPIWQRSTRVVAVQPRVRQIVIASALSYNS
jgi:hypothetical protein